MVVSKLFLSYIQTHTTRQIQERAFHVVVTNLVVGKLGVTAIAKGTRDYRVHVVLYEGKIHSTSCTCPFAAESTCKHIVAVLKAADESLLLHASANTHSTNKIDQRTAHPTVYSFLDFSFDQLTNPFILKHLGATSSNTYRNEIIQKLEYGKAIVSISRSFYDRQEVTITYHNGDLSLDCSCYTPKSHLCEHQEKAMFLLKDNTNLRLFFDAELRTDFLKKKVVDYGLENETNLDDYFQLKLEYNQIVLQPLVKGLVSMGKSEQLKMTNALKIKPKIPVEFGVRDQLLGKTFIVFGKERNDDEFYVNIMSSSLTKEGKIKNPIRLVDAKKLLLQSEEAAEMKFYMAMTQFQAVDFRYSDSLSPDLQLSALRSIVKNPLDLEVFCLNLKKSDNITANSIEPVKMRKVDLDLHLKVVQKDNFYEITPKVFLDGSSLSHAKIKLVYAYFLRVGNELLFVPDMDAIRVLSYWKKQQNKLLIHHSKFEEFRSTILADLEGKISMDYTFLKPASANQLAELGFNETHKKMVYLTDSDDFVLVTPVLQYGAVEVPIRSKKRIYALDAVGEAIEVERDDAAEHQMLRAIQNSHPNFDEQEGFDYFYLHKKHFLDEGWFLEVFEKWHEDEIEILGFNDLKNNNLSPSKMKVAISVSSGLDWFDTAINVSFGNQQVRLKDIQRSVLNKSRFVKLGDGRLGMMPQDWIEKFSKFFRTGEVHENQFRTSKVHFSIIDDLFEKEVLSHEVTEELEMFRAKLSGFEQIEEVKIPEQLQADLRDYQKHGLNWLHFLDEFNFGGCLADDMGLGKTVQILAFILSLKEKNGQKTHLVVLPTSLLFNWRNEIEKFAPSLQYQTIYGVDRTRNHTGFEQYDIIFTTYGTLLSDIRFMKDFPFDYIFLDESQAIKNPDSKRYKAVRLLQSRNKLVLTGTPIENNTFDLYAQFSFVSPGLLGNLQGFRDNYSIPIDKFKDGLRARELQQKLNPFLLRRTKKQVAKELPEKTEMVIYCEMGKEQRQVYDTYKNEFKLYLQNSDKEELANKNMHILQGLTKLRQICNSPALLRDDEYYGAESSKLTELVEQIEQKSADHKILVFSQFVSMLELIKEKLIEREIGFEYLTGKTKDRAQRVSSFQNDISKRVFLISLKAGGTGLNLTEADYVFIVDPWWNPAVENQAIDRSYRIGQKKNVVAIRLICPDTIEEKIVLLQDSKKELMEDLIKVDAKAVKSLSKEDLLNLLD